MCIHTHPHTYTSTPPHTYPPPPHTHTHTHTVQLESTSVRVYWNSAETDEAAKLVGKVLVDAKVQSSILTSALFAVWNAGPNNTLFWEKIQMLALSLCKSQWLG